MKRNRLIGICLALSLLVTACQQEVEPVPPVSENTAQAQDETPLSRETTIGPVHARVTMSPQKPVLGDLVTLTLDVDADAAVEVEMPEFGDQLGRFNIAEFRPSKQLLDNGRMRYTQTYRLDLPMSGKLRIPSFLVEFTDNRASAQADVKGRVQELLTEEVTFEVESLLPQGEVMTELNPVQPALEELVLVQAGRSYAWLAALLAFLAGVAALVVWRVRRKAVEVVLPPDVVAFMGLDALEKSGIPTDADALDDWYVRLSGILRKYVEGRFALHAPRMTTEEFLRLAQASDQLAREEIESIREILEKSDRVKFTEFLPAQGETIALLGETRRFVERTRPVQAQEASQKT